MDRGRVQLGQDDGVRGQQYAGGLGSGGRLNEPACLTQGPSLRLSSLLFLQVHSHLGLPETLQAIEAGGQVPGPLVRPDAVGQLVCSLRPLALLWGLPLVHGALRKPAKGHQCPHSHVDGHRWVLDQVVEEPSECLPLPRPPTPTSMARPTIKEGAWMRQD